MHPLHNYPELLNFWPFYNESSHHYVRKNIFDSVIDLDGDSVWKTGKTSKRAHTIPRWKVPDDNENRKDTGQKGRPDSCEYLSDLSETDQDDE